MLQVLQHRRIRQTPGTFAIAPFGRLFRPTVAYGDGYSIPPNPGDFCTTNYGDHYYAYDDREDCSEHDNCSGYDDVKICLIMKMIFLIMTRLFGR